LLFKVRYDILKNTRWPRKKFLPKKIFITNRLYKYYSKKYVKIIINKYYLKKKSFLGISKKGKKLSNKEKNLKKKNVYIDTKNKNKIHNHREPNYNSSKYKKKRKL